MYSKKRQFGNQAEEYAVKILIERGFSIIDRNYLKSFGEIDIVARGTDGRVHFVEVKAVKGILNTESGLVPRDTYNPADNVTREKIQKIERVVNSWILERGYDGDWSMDVISIVIDDKKRLGKYTFIQNIY